MSILRLSEVAALCWLIAIFLGATGGWAQEDQRFFGRWLPASTSAGGWPLVFEPGRMYSLNDEEEIIDEEHFQVIRDFGDQLLIKSWYVKRPVEGAVPEPNLVLISVSKRPAYEKFPPYLLLEIDYCGGMFTQAYFFSDDDLEKTWERIVAWSERKGEFPEDLHKDVNRCAIEWVNGKLTLPEASGMGFYRELPPD